MKRRAAIPSLLTELRFFPTFLQNGVGEPMLSPTTISRDNLWPSTNANGFAINDHQRSGDF